MSNVADQTGLLALLLQGLVDDYVAEKIDFLSFLNRLKAAGASASVAQDYVDQALACIEGHGLRCLDSQ